jgi:hypothetical protein
VDPGASLVEIASSVWIEADVYEKDIGLLSLESPVTMKAIPDAFPNCTLSGRLWPGDEIAVAGAFLIDAEPRLNPGAASMYYGASGGPKQGDHSAQRASPQAKPAAGESMTLGPKAPPASPARRSWSVWPSLPQRTGPSWPASDSAPSPALRSPPWRWPGTSAVPVQIPLSMVADVKIVEGPAMIKSENGMPCSCVQLNVRDRDIVGFVEEARTIVAEKVKVPQGMYLQWSGQFENQLRLQKTMRIVFPGVLLLIFIILCLTYNDVVDGVLMMMAVPEALVGGVLFLWLCGYRYSAAVQVGFIACFGMATETGIIMLVYPREAIEKRGGLENIRSLAELRGTVLDGAVHRLRPKLLTEGAAILSLAPMLWASGVGHEVISVLAAPVLGGLLIADEVVDIFIPVRFYLVRRRRWLKLHGLTEADAS